MDPERWKQIEDLLQQALDLEPEKREALLERMCAGDKALRREIELLLSKEADAQSFMESPAVACIAEQIAEPAREPPSQISHYRIAARIGTGGMGEVYRAHDEALGRTVALKMLPLEFTSDPDRVRRFEQEAFAASRLNHPNIITIFEITHTGDSHFIVEEYVSGRTLRELLTDSQSNKPRRLDIDQGLAIAIQIAEALKAAHTAWIIHRDIKPENIMIRDDELVKVLDFGIAKLAEQQDPDTVSLPASAQVTDGSSLTIPGAIMGTASYMSPEQASGEQLDGRTDLFSLGLLLYEMFVGERIFAASTRAEVLQAARGTGEVVPASARFSRIPNVLQRIIRKALRRDRDERYASANDLLEELKRAKRRREGRTARRIIGLGALAMITAVILSGVAAFLSVNEVWEEKILRDGHTAAVRRAVFSPDGRLLVSVGEDHRVIVWDFVRRERLKTLFDHTGVVNAVAFSPDGKWFATGSEDQTIIIWDAQRLEQIRVLRDHPGPVRTVSVSSFGHLMVSSSDSKGTSPGRTFVWDTDSWQIVLEPKHYYPYGNHIFLENNHWLAARDGRMWDLTTGQQVEDVREEWDGGWVDVSPDGKRWAAIDHRGNVKFVDLRSQKLVSSQPAHDDHGRSVAYSPDGKWLASAAERIVLWDARTMQKIVPLEYESIVWSVAFSPDGRWLVSTHGDGAVLVWDVLERELMVNLREHSAGVRAVAFSPDGRRAATASEDHSVIIWDLETGQKQAVLIGHRTRVMAVTFSTNGRWLASADQSGNVIRWNINQRSPVFIASPPIFQSSYCLAISPDGRALATTYAVYDAETGHPIIAQGSGPWNQIYGAAFSADGKKLIGVADRGDIVAVDAVTWQITHAQKWADTSVISISLSPDGKTLVTGEDGKAIRLGTIEPLTETAVLGHHEARIKSVAFSPDGKRVVSAGDDKMIALWDVSNRKLITTIGTHTSPIYSIAFSPDGQRLLSGEHDRSVRLYTRHRELWGFRLQ